MSPWLGSTWWGASASNAPGVLGDHDVIRLEVAVDDTCGVGLGQAGKNLPGHPERFLARLTKKAPPALLAVRQARRQYFQRHLAAKRFVLRPIHDAHPSPAEHREHTKMAEQQAHGIGGLCQRHLIDPGNPTQRFLGR